MEINSEAKSHFEAGNKLFEDKKYVEACIDYVAAILIEPNYIEARLEYINALVGYKNYTRALEECKTIKEILDKNPNDENDTKFRFELYLLWGFVLSNIPPVNYQDVLNKCREAIKLYEKYPDEDNKGYVTLYSFYIVMLYVAGYYNEAVETYPKLIEANPQDNILIDILIIYGHALNNLDRYDEALAQYRQAISLDKNNTNKVAPLFSSGTILYKQEKYNDAIIEFEKALEYENKQENKVNLIHIYRNLGYVLLALNRYTEAIEKFNKIVEIDTTQQNDALFGIAEVYLKQKDFEKFNKTYDKMVDIPRGKPQLLLLLLSHPIKTIKKLLQNNVIVYMDMIRGDKLYLHGCYSEATQAYQSVFSDTVFTQNINIFLPKPEHQQELGSIISFYQFLKNPKYFLMLGNLHYAFFYNLKKAEYAYLQGLKLDNQNLEILINLGHLYLEKHRTSSDGNDYYWKAQHILNKAKDILEKTLISNDNLSVLLQLGKICILLKDYDKAEEYIIKAYTKNRQNTLPFIGLIYLYKKEFYKAINYYKELLEIEQHNISTRINLASIYFQQNEYENAEVEYKQVLGIAPRNVEAHIGLGEIYINLGNQHNESKYYSQALGYFEKAIEISSSNNKSKKLNNMELASVHYFIGYAKLKLYLIANNARSFWKLKSAQRSFKKCLKYDKSNSQAHLMVKNISERLLPLYRDYGIATLFIIFAISFSWGIYLFNLDKEKDIIIWLVPIALAALGLYFPSITKFKIGDIEIEKSPAKETTSIFSGVDIEKVSLEKEKMIIPTPSLNIIK